MSAEQWQFLIGLGVIASAVLGVAWAIAGRYFRGVDEGRQQAQEALEMSRGLASDILDMSKRLDGFTARMDRLEGGVQADLRRVESSVNGLALQFAELKGELRLMDKVRGLVGKRSSDAEV